MHLGVTETGIKKIGIIKSAVGIGSLLSEGIGDTIRVSLTGSPEEEVAVAKTILESLELKEKRLEIVSCPTCGRTEINVEEIAEKIYDKCKNIDKKLKIAVMGCCVNGLGEGKEADFGVAGGKEESIIFAKGRKLKVCKNENIYDELLKIITEY